jgi:hypothetical protein
MPLRSRSSMATPCMTDHTNLAISNVIRPTHRAQAQRGLLLFWEALRGQSVSAPDMMRLPR